MYAYLLYAYSYRYVYQFQVTVPGSSAAITRENWTDSKPIDHQYVQITNLYMHMHIAP